MQPGDIVNHKTDKRWREGTVKCIASYDRVYVEWPENQDNGYTAYSPHAISALAKCDGQLTLF